MLYQGKRIDKIESLVFKILRAEDEKHISNQLTVNTLHLKNQSKKFNFKQ